ncbi:MAG: metallophosphoesterase [Planctomycetota bacterium]
MPGLCPASGPCTVVSDLHLFTRRSRAHAFQDQIEEAALRSHTLVLAGDIVDFRWSELGSDEATVDAAEQWIERLLERAPELRVHYVLGNHDDHPQLIERLRALEARHGRVRHERFELRIGNALFLHGDAGNPGMNAARLRASRGRTHGRSPRSLRAARAYDAAVAARLHVVGARIAFPERRLLARLHRYMGELDEGLTRGVRNVYFGHTHRALTGVEFRGRRFHNCGSPIDGLEFRILEADLS